MTVLSDSQEVLLEQDFQRFFRSVVLDHLSEFNLNGYKHTFNLESRALGSSILSLRATTFLKGSKRVIDYGLRLSHNSGFPSFSYGTPITPVKIIFPPSIPLYQLWEYFYGFSDEIDFFSSSFDFQLNQAIKKSPHDGKRRVLDLIEKRLDEKDDNSPILLLEGSFLSSSSQSDDFYYRVRFVDGCIGKVLNSPLRGPISNKARIHSSRDAVKVFVSINSLNDFLKCDHEWGNS